MTALANGHPASTKKPKVTWKMPAGLEGRASIASDLFAESAKAPAFVVDQLIEPGDVVLLKGAEKVTLKTWLAIYLAIALVTGEGWLGFTVKKCRPKRVLAISTETRASVFVRRLISACGQSLDAEIVSRHVVIIDEPITFVSSADRERVKNKAYGKTQLVARGTFNIEEREKIAKSAGAVADWAEANLGHNVDLLDAFAVPDTWSIIIVDTLRQCLAGDENSSNDARQFIAACRELARKCGCPVLIIHHTGKAGDASEARSSRGSTEFTAGPDVVISLDASGEHPTATFLCRNHESPPPIGYKLVTDATGVKLITLAPSAGRSKSVTEDAVLAVFEAHADKGLSITWLRKLLAAQRGKAKGNKASLKTVQKQLDTLIARGAISACKIRPKSGDDFDGYRLGPDGGVVPAVRIDADDAGISNTLEDFLGDGVPR